MTGSQGSLTVISGFSGAGKGSIVRRLLQRWPNYEVSVSVTTRSPRPGERDGVDYHFISQEIFDALVRDGGLLEHAGYVNHCYGTPARFVADRVAAGRDVILEIEVQGALQVRSKCPEAILLFVTPPSARELYRRLAKRGTEPEEEILRRMERAREEAGAIPMYDYLIVNDELEAAAGLVNETIQCAKNTPGRRADLVGALTRELGESWR